MFPGLGGLNPKKMQAMMKQLGIAQEEIDASEVIIKKTDGSSILIKNPSVQKIKMQGQESFQITGEIHESSPDVITEDDIKLVMEKTNKPEEEVRAALKETNDIAEAILKLSQ
ncbi:MAG: nascent polypeptide-associated complex protein [Bacteroidetes bacterium]|nr:MAG: nascent polypeptide-associated complex protein [Bacteroidota bacterium]